MLIGSWWDKMRLLNAPIIYGKWRSPRHHFVDLDHRFRLSQPRGSKGDRHKRRSSFLHPPTLQQSYHSLFSGKTAAGSNFGTSPLPTFPFLYYLLQGERERGRENSSKESPHSLSATVIWEWVVLSLENGNSLQIDHADRRGHLWRK